MFMKPSLLYRHILHCALSRNLTSPVSNQFHLAISMCLIVVLTEHNVFLNMTPCSLALIYWRFRGTVCLHRQPDDEGIMFARNYICARLHGVTSQKVISLVIVARVSNLKNIQFCCSDEHSTRCWRRLYSCVKGKGHPVTCSNLHIVVVEA